MGLETSLCYSCTQKTLISEPQSSEADSQEMSISSHQRNNEKNKISKNTGKLIYRRETGFRVYKRQEWQGISDHSVWRESGTCMHVCFTFLKEEQRKSLWECSWGGMRSISLPWGKVQRMNNGFSPHENTVYRKDRTSHRMYRFLSFPCNPHWTEILAETAGIAWEVKRIPRGKVVNASVTVFPFHGSLFL